MITEDSIATAQLAQLFGSELLKAQQSARTDGGSVPNFVQIDPKQFLVPSGTRSDKQTQASIIRKLQLEAEAAYPLPPLESPSGQPNEPQNEILNNPNRESISNSQHSTLNDINKNILSILEELKNLNQYISNLISK